MLRSHRRTRNRIAFAVALAVALILLDSAAHLSLLLAAPHFAKKVIPTEKPPNVHLLFDGSYAVDDYDGTLYHYHNNQRLTIGQPVSYTHTVWIFGNSGAFGLYVSDADTMESRLQALLNASGYRWRVVNAAISGQYVAGELAQMRDSGVKSGDIVVFDDGGMDLIYNYYDHCDGVSLALLRVACQIVYRPQDANAAMRAGYVHVVGEAQAWAMARGAIFIHCLQPTPYEALYANTPGVRLVVPNDDIMDAWHLTPNGERIEAYQIFDALTLI